MAKDHEDPSKPFDPVAQFADFGALWSRWANPFAQFGTLPLRYETVNPIVQEIAILAAMHNLASLVQKPEKIKAAIGEALAERAQNLADGV